MLGFAVLETVDHKERDVSLVLSLPCRVAEQESGTAKPRGYATPRSLSWFLWFVGRAASGVAKQSGSTRIVELRHPVCTRATHIQTDHQELKVDLRCLAGHVHGAVQAKVCFTVDHVVKSIGLGPQRRTGDCLSQWLSPG